MNEMDQVFHCWYFTNPGIEAKILKKRVGIFEIATQQFL